MLEQDLLAKVIQFLDDNKIDYMLTGSYVSSMQGQPRSTNDIDIIVVITESQVSRFAKSFPFPDFYLDEESIIEAIEKIYVSSPEDTILAKLNW